MEPTFRIVEVERYNGRKEYQVQENCYTFIDYTLRRKWFIKETYGTLKAAKEARDTFIGNQIKSTKVIE